MKIFSVSCPHCQQGATFSVQALSNTIKCDHCHRPVLDGQPVEADGKNFESLIQSPKPVVVTFWGQNCAPCRTFKPIVEQVAAERQKSLRFVRLNVQQNQALASRYKVRGVPTVMVFKKGKLQATLPMALKKKEFGQWLNEVFDR
ncbi:thioredoxin TrxC [Photobacterium sp. MCCC 1A19761]|uniref:thioredoxin TrxC n=1 Tax=Photobacterium sp. MCCC 1A19761 TaxID=3115000 RepID=UPI00307F321B